MTKGIVIAMENGKEISVINFFPDSCHMDLSLQPFVKMQITIHLLMVVVYSIKVLTVILQ